MLDNINIAGGVYSFALIVALLYAPVIYVIVYKAMEHSKRDSKRLQRAKNKRKALNKKKRK